MRQGDLLFFLKKEKGLFVYLSKSKWSGTQFQYIAIVLNLAYEKKQNV